jgi:hypothetical protein
VKRPRFINTRPELPPARPGFFQWRPITEVVVGGRRSGKSLAVAALAAKLAEKEASSAT